MNPVKILVVDDETDVELLFKQCFRKEIKAGEFTFHYCHSGEDALRFLEEKNPPDVVLVLSDINMPGISGLQLLKEIKSHYPELKVFMITAYGDEKNHREAVSLGADDFITKPVDFSLLKEHILQKS